MDESLAESFTPSPVVAAEPVAAAAAAVAAATSAIRNVLIVEIYLREIEVGGGPPVLGVVSAC